MTAYPLSRGDLRSPWGIFCLSCLGPAWLAKSRCVQASITLGKRVNWVFLGPAKAHQDATLLEGSLGLGTEPRTSALNPPSFWWVSLLGHGVFWRIGSSLPQQFQKYCLKPGFDTPQELPLPWKLDYALVSIWPRQEGPQVVATLAGSWEYELTSEPGIHCTSDPN